jgi:hypothetical protein
MATRTSTLRLIQNQIEYRPVDDLLGLPKGLRGIYVLYKAAPARRASKPHYNVVYVGGMNSHCVEIIRSSELQEPRP